MPTPAGGSEDTISTTGTPTPGTSASKPTAKPTAPTKTAAPPKTQVVVVPGNYADNPAVQGLVAKYPIYYQALVQRDDTVIKNNFPAYFYLDVTNSIKLAKSKGWVMRPPASVVVMSVVQRPFGVVRLNLCLSQSTQYWDPKARKWAKAAPKGMPEVIEMVKTGMGWSMYHKLRPDKPFGCASVRFPA